MGLFPYASVLHVAELNQARGTYTATSKPTATTVHEFLMEIAGEVDARLLGHGYNLPVAEDAATSVRKLLQSVNALGAAWRVEAAAEVRDEAPFYKEMYDSALQMMMGLELDLPKNASTSGPRSGFSATDPIFTLDMEL